ncbi:MAG: response regulator [Spirochaetes bacterium]|nr:response regulator [Spirochaetota bacterium]
MLKNLTLKYRIISVSIGAIVIPFVVAGIVIYIQLSNSLIKIAEEKSVHYAEDLSSLISSRLDSDIRLASSIAAGPEILSAVKTRDYRKAQHELEQIYKRIGEKLFTIFLADENGIARADAFFKQQIGLDMSDREYFKKAKEGIANVAGPILARGTATPGDPVIMVISPIFENKRFYGIVGIPYNTDFILKLLKKRRTDETGYAFIANAEGLITIHPRKELVFKTNLFDLSESEKLREIILSGETGNVRYSFEDSEQLAGITTMGLTDWVVIFSQSRNEIMRPVNRILLSMLISSLAFVLAAVLFIIFFSGRISSPFQKMAKLMKYITLHSREIILQIGTDRKVYYANPAFEKLTGLKSGDVEGTDPVLNNVKRIPAETIWQSLEEGIPWSGRVELEKVQERKKGRIILDVMIFPLRENSGSIHGYLEVGRNVTNEILFERRVRQAQKLEAIGTLAGGIAHDFNNILNIIYGYAELLSLKPDCDSDPEQYAKEILRATERAKKLVQRILTFSRRTEVKLVPVSPESVLNEALDLMRSTIPPNVKIESKLDSKSMIMADPTQMYQVVTNLLTNAVHAIGKNSGRIILELEDFFADKEFTRIHPGITEGEHVIIRISDTGSGIEEENLNQIFEPFFTTKTEGEGTGLGLSVVHGIVRSFGGISTVYSKPGEGSVFNVIIPVSAAGEVSAESEETSVKKGTESILVIDDEQEIINYIQRMLTSAGYSVTGFSDAVMALDSIKSNHNKYDVIITDQTMPVITGLEIAKQLAKEGIDIPLILVSGFFESSIEKEAREIGISELIAKPVNTRQLTGAIHRVLAGCNNSSDLY